MKIKVLLFLSLLSTYSLFAQKKWTLKECVEYALKNNITIKQNEFNIELAEKDVAIARGNFLPDLSASTNGSFTSGLSQDRNGVLQNTQNFNSKYNLSSEATVFNGFRNLNTYKQAQLGVKSSKLDLEVIENDIILRIVNTYLNTLFAKENLEVAKTQYNISKKQIERVQTQFEAGVVPKGNLLNAKSTVANDLQNVVLQENALNLAFLQLTQLLQISSDNFDVENIEIDVASSTLFFDDSKEIFSNALDNRPEIKRAILDIDNADFNIKISKGSYLPTLSFSLGVGSSYFHQFNNLRFSNDNFFSQINDRVQYSVGASLRIPIFNRFQTKNRLAKSLINKEVSEIALENEKLQLKQTIEQAYFDTKAAAKAFEAAEVSLIAQKEAFKNAQVSYDYGATTQFDFDQVRNRLVAAESAMIRAKYDYIFKARVLKFYSGEPVIN